jgi:hypothetical protein
LKDLSSPPALNASYIYTNLFALAQFLACSPLLKSSVCYRQWINTGTFYPFLPAAIVADHNSTENLSLNKEQYG